MPPPPRVAVIGSGFSGLMTALHLLRAGTVRVRLIEKTANFGRGLAYGTANPDHLLNVRAGNMSAWPDEPDHFARWLARHRPEAGAFARRSEYGLYLQGLLKEATEADDRLSLAAGEAIGLRPDGSGWRLDYAHGPSEAVDAVVLAPGNPPPARPDGIDDPVARSQIYHPDPWALEPEDSATNALPILLIGSGLTMVDVALSQSQAAPDRPLIALSRRGLAPLAHAATTPVESQTPPVGAPLTTLLVWLKSEARRLGWREAIDALRPYTPAIWGAWDPTQRRRFLRHARPYWDAHRHRLAPDVAQRIQTLLDTGTLTHLTGRIESLTLGATGLQLRWRPRGRRDIQTLAIGRAINCTGPAATIMTHKDQLLASLCTNGLARGDALGLGLDVDQEGRLIKGDGTSHRNLFAVGPVTRGAFWEVTAVPDIRVQAAHTARAVIQAQETKG
ncbi:FAD/NAD(P)-binding protein [Caulobacter henricii]|uniref:FAD-dependent urate hydroxylase HpyO/Asp monooxygenase CreE-like FAD/NAD(P)-binding domain-containing protein n=1 Tax=Caulobacter henricii TaxID=69395 RepID=A0A0P0NXU6_9CAUL|nr:FAD/NAD(P)-binding protein [Caulobacter henricii]ALL12895.1 hypothetical protein AQ619_05750 [Caulobacter henricii]